MRSDTQLANIITVDDVQVDLFQVALGEREGFAAIPFAQVGKFAKRRAGFATLNKLGIFQNVSKVFVVPEATVAKAVVYFT